MRFKQNDAPCHLQKTSALAHEEYLFQLKGEIEQEAPKTKQDRYLDAHEEYMMREFICCSVLPPFPARATCLSTGVLVSDSLPSVVPLLCLFT